MPKTKIVKKSINDKFYTKQEIVDMCLSHLNPYLSDDDFYIEPQCGSGAFFHKLQLPRIGLDIEPDCEDAIKMSWFDYNPPSNGVVVGNPPFGERNHLTKKFITHGLTCKIIAFILPAVFNKETMQKVFPDNWILVKSVDLPHGAFLLDRETYHVPQVFQIWIKNSNLPDLRESKKEPFVTTDFKFCSKKEATHFMFGAAPNRLIPPNEVLTNNRGYYILCSDEVATRLMCINWKNYALSSVNGGVAWYTKKQILNIYGEKYGKK